ncbi:TPR repeat [alpha proteobacterium U9-1i]|nr:TPR repeat [alpha proteobacterium U9-1i]
MLIALAEGQTGRRQAEARASLAMMHNNRGVALFRLGQIERAIEDYTTALSLNASMASAYENRGNAYAAQDNHAAATADYDRAIALNPRRAGALLGRGNARLAAGDAANALNDYNQALALNPGLNAAILNRALAYAALGDGAAALEQFDLALALSPDDANAYYNRGNIFLAQGETARAIADYDQALALSPTLVSAFNNRGNAYWRLADAERAISDYAAALRLRPELTSARENMANICRAIGGDERAIAECEQGGDTEAVPGAAQAEGAIIADSAAELESDDSDPAVAVAQRAARAGRPPEERRFVDTQRGGGACAYCPEMVVAPAGTFRLGSSRYEIGRDSDEGPVQQVRIAAFAVGRFEVTRRQWLACVVAGACTRTNLQTRDLTFPVSDVSWNDAQAYVAWLSRLTGQNYRLLSEAEWEYAARARSRTPWSWGSDQAQSCLYANTWDQSADPSARTPCNDGHPRGGAPVGSLAANAFGLHDMHGNVWEWVEDCYTPAYAPRAGSSQRRRTVTGDVMRPGYGRRDGAATEVSEERCADRVDRGGAWIGDLNDVRSAQRSRHTPTLRAEILGFRVARDLN